MIFCGCVPQQQPERPEQQLISESPFHSEVDQDLSQVIIITCTCHMFEIPAHVDASGWWQRPGQTAQESDSTDPNTPQTSLSAPLMPLNTRGLDQSQVGTWNNNGLQITAFANADWEQLRPHIVAANAVSLPTRQAMIRRADEIMELPMIQLAEEHEVFVGDSSGGLRGYSLPIGESLFRFSATLEQFTPRRFAHFELVPVVKSSDIEERFGRDEYGTLRQLTRNPEILFDQLRLSGILEDNWSICVIAKSTGQRLDSLGQILMVDNYAAENRQVVFLLTLDIQTAQELRNSAQ